MYRADSTPSKGAASYSRAKCVIQSLVEGTHPKTGKDLNGDTVMSDVDVVRALLVAITAIDQVQARAMRRSMLPEDVGKTWSPDEERALVLEFQAGDAIPDIATKHKRTVRAIEARLERLGMLTADQRTTSNNFIGASTGRTDNE